MTVIVFCNDHEDVVKALSDYDGHIVFVDWSTNRIFLEGNGQGDFKQDSELAFVKSGGNA